MNSFLKRSLMLAVVTLFLAAWLTACAGAAEKQVTQEPVVTPTSESSEGENGQEGSSTLKTVYSNFATDDFSGSGNCSMCHLNLIDQSGKDVSMPPDWASTMMANSAKDPVWQAKVSSEVMRNESLKEVIEEKCTSCHMPMAVNQAKVNDQPVAASGEGFFDPGNPLHEAAIEGVSCTLCHQVQAENLGTKESFSGGYIIDTSTDAPNRPIFGPYQQPVAQQMQNTSGFTPMYGEQMLSAEHCGSCHNLYTPYVDAEGNILGEFPEQTPYTEWQNSQFGENTLSCQSCHMPFAQGSVVISQVPANLSPREPFYQHFFVGGNTFMLQILIDYGTELEVTADETLFDNTQERVLDQITNNTAAIALVESQLDGSTLTATIKVTAMTGHKFPTGFPSRRTWVHFTVTDASGNVVFESGKPNGDGSIEGNIADTDATAYEPHYEIISQTDQVQIYEPIMGDSDGQVTYTLLRAAEYLKDNRLLPSGADKTQLPDDVAVYGEAAADENFVGGSDQLTYQIDLSGVSGPFSINAELLYEPLSYQFIQDLLLDDDPLIDRFGGYYAAADRTPLVVASMPESTIQ